MGYFKTGGELGSEEELRRYEAQRRAAEANARSQRERR
jgi:hypothetical protein